MVPKVGPLLYSLSSFANVAIAGPGTITQRFRWPRPVFVTGIKIVTQTALATDLASLTLAISDETQHQVIYSWQGGTGAPVGAVQGIGGLGGPGPLLDPGMQWLAVQRPVMASDIWVVTAANVSGAPISLACLLMRFDEGAARAA